MNAWWKAEGSAAPRTIRILDLACGSGEVTEALDNWLRTAYYNGMEISEQTSQPIHRRKLWQQSPPGIRKSEFTMEICASDPFTSPAYEARVKRKCATLSFQDIANGSIPDCFSTLGDDIIRETSEAIEHGEQTEQRPLDMIICSFALHLVETPSQLFGLLWELSQKARWLVVIAPHKKPEMKYGWGWQQWDIGSWTRAEHGQSRAGIEILQHRVHLRAFRSLN